MAGGIKAICLGLGIVLATVQSGAALAQDYPTKPIRLISPFGEGGRVDSLIRVLAPRLADALGQPFNVEVRSGQGGTEAAETTARAAADGHTLMIGGVTAFAIVPAIRRKLPYHPVRDFTPLGQVGEAPLVLLATPSLPARSVAQLISYAKSHPHAVSFASSSRTSISHMAAEQFRLAAGISLQPVAYKTMSLAIPDLLTGQVSLLFEAVAPALEHARSGALIVMGSTASASSPLVLGLPTLAENGLSGFNVVKWIGLFGPAGLPETVVRRIDEELQRALRAPDLRQRFMDLGMEAKSAGSAAFGSLAQADFARWSMVAKEAGIVTD